MDTFFKLLVKDSLDREDVEALEKENTRNAHEVLQLFRDSRGIYKSFITKSLIQLTLGSVIAYTLVWVLSFGLAKEQISCSVFTQVYVCVVPLADFYNKIVMIASAAIIGICGKIETASVFPF